MSTSLKDIRRSRIASNSGSIMQDILIAEVEDFTTIAAAPTLTPDTATNNVADIAARDAISTPTNLDTAYVQTVKQYFVYNGTAWVRLYQTVITDSHVFPTDIGFHVLQATLGKRGMEITGPEEMDISGFEQKTTFSVPKMDEEIADYMKDIAFKNLIVIIQGTDGQYYQHGNATNPATIKLNSAGTGVNVLDYNGTEFSINSNESSLTIYKGTITKMTD